MTKKIAFFCGTKQKMVWERLSWKKERKQVNKQQQWESLGGGRKLMGPGEIYGEKMNRKWTGARFLILPGVFTF